MKVFVCGSSCLPGLQTEKNLDPTMPCCNELVWFSSPSSLSHINTHLLTHTCTSALVCALNYSWEMSVLSPVGREKLDLVGNRCKPGCWLMPPAQGSRAAESCCFLLRRRSNFSPAVTTMRQLKKPCETSCNTSVAVRTKRKNHICPVDWAVISSPNVIVL